MKLERKYLVAVALLVVLAALFGLAGTVMPVTHVARPQQSSSSDPLTHFINPPTYDSGWLDISDKLGQSFGLTHDLNTTEAFVDIVGKQNLTGGDHKLFFGATSYTPSIWNQTYGDADYDTAYSMIQTSDGGYAMVGITKSFGAGQDDFYLVKTDSNGNVQWNQTQTYGGAFSDYGRSVVQTVDGGYALAGYTGSYGAGDADFYLVKTDSAGNMQWNKTYGGASIDRAYSVVETVDGGYALAGCTASYGGGWLDFWLVKTDSNGNVQWNQTYGGVNEEYGYSMVQTADGGYAIAGYTEPDFLDYDLWLVKTDASGIMEWNQTYVGLAYYSEVAYSVVQTSDGGYTMAGDTNSYGAGGTDFWLVKTDSDGNALWNQTYGGAGNEEAHSVVETADGGYALAGYTRSLGAGGTDFWLVKTDSDGNMEWNETYGGALDDDPFSVVQTSDGGYALAGYTRSYGAGKSDFWLVAKNGIELGFSYGLSIIEFTDSIITLYRGTADPYWNYVRVRIWLIEEPLWQFGDINQDGVVDTEDLFTLSQNYGS